VVGLTAPLAVVFAGMWLAVPTTLRHAEAVVVNGGGIPRTRHALALYHQGMVPEFWHTGGPEAWLTEQVVVWGGVPPENFHYLASTNTWEDGRQIAIHAQSRQIQSLLLVTDWWHSRRALCTLRAHLGTTTVQVAFSSAPASADPSGWWRHRTIRRYVLRELVAIPYYSLRYGMWPFGCG
jgi:uncharacterized SAM-binding protein YcdF (DUF218 family)